MTDKHVIDFANEGALLTSCPQVYAYTNRHRAESMEVLLLLLTYKMPPLVLIQIEAGWRKDGEYK